MMCVYAVLNKNSDIYVSRYIYIVICMLMLYFIVYLRMILLNYVRFSKFYFLGDFGNCCALDSWAKNKEEGDTRYCAGTVEFFFFMVYILCFK
jgi:hypothetical protein